MIPEKVKSLIDKFCMGVHPTEQQQDMIMDLTANLDADPREVAAYMKEMISGPTREQREAAAKAEAARRAREEKERREREEAERKAESARKAKEEKERREREEAERKAEAARKAREEKEQKERQLLEIEIANNEKLDKLSKKVWRFGKIIGISFFVIGLWCGLNFIVVTIITILIIIAVKPAKNIILSKKSYEVENRINSERKLREQEEITKAKNENNGISNSETSEINKKEDPTSARNTSATNGLGSANVAASKPKQAKAIILSEVEKYKKECADKKSQAWAEYVINGRKDRTKFNLLEEKYFVVCKAIKQHAKTMKELESALKKNGFDL